MTTNLKRQKQIATGLFAWVFAISLFAAQDPFLTIDSVVQTNGQLQFNLNGEDSVTYVIEGSGDLQNWTPVLTNSDQPATRAITVDGSQDFGFYRASRGPLPLFAGAITAKSSITMEGNHIFTDSFDSSDTNDFPGEVWNATNRRGNGNVAVGSSSISIGNADIMGKVLIQGTFTDVIESVGPDGAVGDVAFVTGGGTGIESPFSNFVALDFRFCLPDVPVPFTSGAPILPPAGGETNTLSSGTYYYNGTLTFPNTADLQIGPYQSVVLYVTGSFLMKGASKIDIQPGGTLALYVGGASSTLAIINSGGVPANFQYYGLPGNTNVAFAGNGAYLGTVYAPEATVTLDGTVDFSGALVGNNIRLISEINVHYDENLARSGPQR